MTYIMICVIPPFSSGLSDEATLKLVKKGKFEFR